MAKTRYQIQVTDSVTPELAKISASLKKFEAQTKAIGDGLKKAGGAVAGFFGAGALISGAKEAVEVWKEWEKQNQRLTASLGLGANTSRTMTKDFQALADSMESLLNVDDKLVMAEAGKLATLGRTKSEIEKILQASADLSTALGISFSEASDMLAKSFSGTAPKELKKLIPDLASLSSEALKSGQALEVVNKQFGGLAGQANSGAFASLNRLGSSFENLQTEVGRFIANAGQDFFNWLGDVTQNSAGALASLNNYNEATRRLIKNTYALGQAGREARLMDKLSALDEIVGAGGFGNKTYSKLYGTKSGSAGIANGFSPEILADIMKNGGRYSAPGQASYQVFDQETILTLSEVFKARGTSISQITGQDIRSLTASEYSKTIKTLNAMRGDIKEKLQDLENERKAKVNALGASDAVEIPAPIQGTASARPEAKNQVEETLKFFEEIAPAIEEADRSQEEFFQGMAKGVSEFGQVSDQLLSAFNSIQQMQNATTQNYIDNLKRELDETKSTYEKQLKTKRDLGEETTQFELDMTAKIEAEKARLAEEEKALKKKQFETNKATSLISATINGAEAVTKALSSAGPPYNFILAGAVGVATAAQIALIASQPTPQFATGTPYAPGGLALVGEAGPELVNLPRGAGVIPAPRTADMIGGQAQTVYQINVEGSIIAESELFRQIARKTKELERKGQL